MTTIRNSAVEEGSTAILEHILAWYHADRSEMQTLDGDSFMLIAEKAEDTANYKARTAHMGEGINEAHYKVRALSTCLCTLYEFLCSMYR